MSALSQIKSRLQKEPESLNLMNLTDIKIGTITPEIKEYLEKFKKVKVLILNGCDLSSLDNLPNWKLSAIDLSNNNFKDDIIAKLATMATLTQILLMENKIQSVENLKQLSVIKTLSELDFSGCPVANETNYRPILFDSIKGLQILDQHNLNGDFVGEEEEDGDESEFEGDDDDSEQEDYEQEQSSDRPKPKTKKK